MSKQSSVLSFMSRHDDDISKPVNADKAPTMLKSTGKFKFNAKPTREPIQLSPDENRTTNTIQPKSNTGWQKKADDCVVISDESMSPVKNVPSKPIDDDDDIFAQSPVLTFTKASSLATKEAKTMEDLYAKYGSPGTEPKKSFDKLDIDKELSLNPNYQNAMKKLDEDMQILRSSPKKSAGVSKFKFNKKPAASTNQTSTKSSFSFSSSSSGLNSLNPITNTSMSKTCTVTTASVQSAVNGFSSINLSSIDIVPTTEFNPYKPIVSASTSKSTSTAVSSGKFKPVSTAPVNVPNDSFKLVDNSPKDITSPPSTSPGSSKDPFSQIETFIKKVNGTPSLSAQSRNNLSDLRKNSKQLEQWYSESIENYCAVFDSLPKSTLEMILGNNTETFLKLKTLKQGFKAKMKVNQRSISKLESELEQVHDLTHFDEPLNPTNFSAASTNAFTSSYPSSYQSSNPMPSSNDDAFPMDDFDEYDLMVSQNDNFGASSMNLTSVNDNMYAPYSASTSQPKSTSQSSQNSMGNFYSGTKNDGLTGEFDGYGYEHSESMQNSLRYKFGLKTFRPNQLQVINATMMNFDCFVLMPTGGGKSLCYQLPATLTESLTIVISPLKSLILDQVNKLQALDVVAQNLSGEQTLQEINAIYRDLQCDPPRIKVLYVTPEKISASPRLQDLFKKIYSKNLIARFVIDEAHCVSHWGHDFRPDYTKLCFLRETYPNVPIMALTATATTRVRADIVQQLKLKTCKWFLCSFNRLNLQYLVKPKSGVKTIEEIKELIKTKFPRASGIVYCLSRKECDQMAENLKSVGIKAASYHAGLADKKREEVQKDWITDKFKVVCATIAFGMGIDKPDVRYVLHFSLPKSIEGYYQESGRAGRDGLKSICILYYSYADMVRLIKLMDLDTSISMDVKKVHTNNLRKIVNYCENVIDCRRSIQLNYFAENFTREQCLAEKDTACDNCLNNEGEAKFTLKDVTNECKKVIKAVRDLCNGDRSRVTLLQIVEVFLGKNVKNVVSNGWHESEYHGLLKSWSNSDVSRLMHRLVLEEYLREQLFFVRDIPLAYLKLGPNVDKLMTGNTRIEFAVENAKAKKGKKTDVNLKDGRSSATNEAFKKIQDDCYADLLQKCQQMAIDRNVTVASVMNNQALKEMAEKLPSNEEEMMKIAHVTRANYDKYGKELLPILQNYGAERAMVDLDMDQAIENGSNLSFSDEDNTNWCSLATAGASGSGTGTAGRKRKRAFGNSFRRKKGTAKKAGTPKRRKTTATKATTKKGSKATTGAARGVGANRAQLLRPRTFDGSF